MSDTPSHTPAVASPSASHTPLGNVEMTFRDKRLWALSAILLALASVATLIGEVDIPLGTTVTLTLLPMIWAILGGAFISGNPWKALPVPWQEAAGILMNMAVLILGARLSFNIGPNIPTLLDAGPALLLQEVGHLFGTLILALPLAVALKMGPATIGATFSIDREPAFAMVSERYGSKSPQYQGVLSMYVFGTVFGAVIISLVVSITMGFGLLDPLALAMGSGVGSGSMMAAAAAVITNGHPEMADQVLAMAATSNLITTVLGLYVGIWVALPMADWLYRKLSGNKDLALTKEQMAKKAELTDDPEAEAKVARLLTSSVRIPTWITVTIIFVVGVLVSLVDYFRNSEPGATFNWGATAAGWAVMLVLTIGSQWVAHLTKGKIPGIAIVMTAGAYFSSAWFPWSEQLLTAVDSTNLTAIITLILAMAGLSLGKDLPMLKTIGWKIIPVGIVAVVASFLCAAVIAEFALGFWAV
ncbi:MAG: DUF3100 domain-containing protein [Ancrocorticia sp.]|uniref:DUF3100 domain-containing protein n=1 Tax=Ancrocorticia sp. TaxID=2593684 RepID=UPI003F911FE1